jgi:hypothetical protein
MIKKGLTKKIQMFAFSNFFLKKATILKDNYISFLKGINPFIFGLNFIFIAIFILEI